jgi:hypothetical protein
VIYETGSDRNREDRLASILTKRFGAELKRTAKLHGCDYFTYSKKYSRWMMVEVKSRHGRWDDYPDKLISMNKIGNAVSYLHMKVGYLIAYFCEDKLGIFVALHASKVDPYEKDVRLCKQPDGSMENTLVVLIPNDQFTLIELTDEERKLIWKT